MVQNQLALKAKLSDMIAEYEAKNSCIGQTVANFVAAGEALKMASCVSGTFGQTQLNVGHIHERDVATSLLKSAWHHTYGRLQIDLIASAEDKRRFQQAMASPPPFTMDNLRATFGPFISDPWGNILRGMAEAFCSLDPAYKSHDKMKVGVSGLPKRVIVSGFGDYGSWGRDRVRDILNALAAYQGKPLVEYDELARLMKQEDALLEDWESDGDREKKTYPARGIRLRRFENGNGHLFFEKDTLLDINRALAEYYGEVLADCSDDGPAEKRASTALSKDLQYYPTPAKVVERVVGSLHIKGGDRVLEPSCGCGRFLDALRKLGAETVGVEVDPGRAAQCRSEGHNVLVENFLETLPTGDFDRVVMNPPFYGQHYAKHVRHAVGFLKPGGTLTAILPVTARYDHGALDDLVAAQGRHASPWQDLPVGAFSESGTNINTTVLTLHAENRAA